MHIYTCTVEGAAPTNLSAVLPFWIKEENRIQEKTSDLYFSQHGDRRAVSQ